MVERASELPDFEDPPVNETVLSIQFADIPKFGIPHYGLYWARIRDRFPEYQVHPALPHVREKFGAPVIGQRLGFQFVTQPDVRCWFLDPAGTRLIQVQRDRFIHNWRQLGTEIYPRYPALRKNLEDEWTLFCRFLTDDGLEQPQVNQCEVTYVNHLEYGKGWTNFGELSEAIASWSGQASGDFLPPPERVSMEVHYRPADEWGRLHISVEPVIRGRDSQEVLQVTLVARGAPKSSSTQDVLIWMDLGREWVVKGFADFTTKSMHSIWRRRS